MSSLVRVAFIVPSLANKGPIRVVQGIIKGAQKLGLPVTFTVFYLKVANELEMECRTMLYDSSVDLSEFDVVHTHGIRPDAIAFMRRRTIKKHMTTVHNLVFQDLTYEYNRLVSIIAGNVWIYLWRRADVLVGISEHVRSYYKSYRVWNRMVLVYNGIAKQPDTDDADENDRDALNLFRTSGKTTIGVACQVTARKGIDLVIDLLAARPDLQLLLVGDGNGLTGIRARADRLRVADRCIFLGYRHEGTRYFRYFDIFAMPSRSEGFGLTLIEAARARVPVICSDIPTFRELFTDKEVAFFDLDNTASMSKAVDYVLKNRIQIVKSGLEKFENCYTDEMMAKNYYNEYLKLCNSVSGR